MYTKQDLTNHLREIGVQADGTLMVHISYKAVGEVDGRGDTVLNALADFMRPGLLVLPAHTWSNVTKQNPVMDVLHTPSCVGALTELFRKREGVVRSLHPTHSLAATGADAETFVAGEEKINTPCGKGGAYYKLWQRNAQILLIGVNFSANTFIHGVEEWDKATSTISEQREDYYVINEHGNRLHTPQYRHCAPVGSKTFTKLEPAAITGGILTTGRFGDATARLMHAKPLRTMIAQLLKANPSHLIRY